MLKSKKKESKVALLVYNRLGPMEAFLINSIARITKKNVEIFLVLDILTNNEQEVRIEYIEFKPSLVHACCKNPYDETTIIRSLNKEIYKEIYVLCNKADLVSLKRRKTPFTKTLCPEHDIWLDGWKLIEYVYRALPKLIKPKLAITPDLHICSKTITLRENGKQIGEKVVYTILTNFYTEGCMFINSIGLHASQSERTEEFNRILTAYDRFMFYIVGNFKNMSQIANLINAEVTSSGKYGFVRKDIDRFFNLMFMSYLNKEFDSGLVTKLWVNREKKDIYLEAVKTLWLLLYSRYNNQADLLAIYLPEIYNKCSLLYLGILNDSIMPLLDAVRIGEEEKMLRFTSRLDKDRQNIRLNYLHDHLIDCLYEDKLGDNYKILIIKEK